MRLPVVVKIDPAVGKDDAFDATALDEKLIAQCRVGAANTARPPRPIRDLVLVRRLSQSARALTVALLRPEPSLAAAIVAYARNDSLAQSVIGAALGEHHVRLAHLLDAEMERRGEFWGRGHRLNAGMIESAVGATHAVSAVYATSRDDPDHEQLTADADDELALCAQGAAALLDREERPYAGCGPCRFPCWFRYDAHQIVRRMGQEEIDAAIDGMRALLEPEPAYDYLRELQDTCSTVYIREDSEMISGLAFCCLTHILASEDVAVSDHWTREVAPMLNDRVYAPDAGQEDTDAHR